MRTQSSSLMKNYTIPIGSIVVPFWDYLIGFLSMNPKKELLRSLWVYLKS